MMYKSYTKTDEYYQFLDENDNKTLYPVSSIILVDDNSGLISIKTVAARKTIGLVKK